MKEYQNPEVLRKLYWNKGLSQITITKKLNISEDTVRKWMRTFNIPVRQRERNDISKKLLEDLYLKKKLSVQKTATLLKAGLNTIKRKLKTYNIKTRSVIEANTKYVKLPFSGNLKEKAYILGFRTGDLSVIKTGNCIRVVGGTTHPAQVKLIKALFEKYSKITMHEGRIKSDDRKFWVLSCSLDKSFEFLLEKPQEIPKWILNDNNLFYSFLAGYADAEGYWGIYRKNHGNGIYSKKMKVRFQILSGDKIVLNQLYKKLKEFGFHPNFLLSCKSGYHKSNKDLYVLILNYPEEVHQLAKILYNYSKHEEKIWKIKFIIQNLNKDWDEIKNKVERFRKMVKDTRFNETYINPSSG